MSWKKYFTPVDINNRNTGFGPISGGGRAGPARMNYSSYLPDVYAGAPNRIERYIQYDTMDMDSEINAALDILTEFCTQKDKENDTPFQIRYKGQPTSTEVKLIKDSIQKWCKDQKFDTRIFRIMRNVFKYGDTFFIRDPETKKWLYIDPTQVTKIIVNESEGKKPEQYVVKDINFNFKELIATTPHNVMNTQPSGTASYTSGGGFGRGFVGDAARPPGTRFNNQVNEVTIDAKHIVHISLSEGLDNNYPFGNSLLESVFKVYKQKELLEDAIIIYRIQRAPERRIFYVDVGNMPAHMAMSFVERVKNEIQQRRIPSSTGGGSNVIDSSYNPLSVNEDYFFPQTAEGRGSKVDTLPGGTNLGEITDLRYFTNKLFRALRIPASYLPTAIDEQPNTMADGKVGTAYIQELRFNEYCKRLQSLIIGCFDLEFKMWLNDQGLNIDNSLFQLKFNEPQNFAAYRQSELDTARAATYSQIAQIPYLSKRFALKRFLGMTQEEITENERLWREENGSQLKPPTDAEAQLRGIGVTPGGIASDLAGQDAEADADMASAAEGASAGGEVAPTEAGAGGPSGASPTQGSI
jgi:Bacteriophage T4-like portal protein (Gp20)